MMCSVEVIAYMFALKLQCPDKVSSTLLVGYWHISYLNISHTHSMHADTTLAYMHMLAYRCASNLLRPTASLIVYRRTQSALTAVFKECAPKAHSCKQ
jgi:hypothetical protein